MAGGTKRRSSTTVVLEQERPRWLPVFVVAGLLVGVGAFGMARGDPGDSVTTPRPVIPVIAVPAPGTTSPASSTTTMPTTTTTTMPQWVLDDFDPAKAHLPVTAPTAIDHQAAAAQRDLVIDIAPEEPVATVGTRAWITVVVTNHSATNTYRPDAAYVSPLRLSMTHFNDSASGESYEGRLGEPLYSTDGTPLRWYLEPRRYVVDVYLVGQAVADSNERPVEILPGESVRRRFFVDVSFAGPMPALNQVHLNASFQFGPGYHRPIERSVPYRLEDDPDRLPTWSGAINSVANDPAITRWLVSHQGRMDETNHGVRVDVGYFAGAWELTFFRNWSADETATNTDLNVRVPAGAPPQPLDVHETPRIPLE